jgi:hypothetical protein
MRQSYLYFNLLPSVTIKGFAESGKTVGPYTCKIVGRNQF